MSDLRERIREALADWDWYSRFEVDGKPIVDDLATYLAQELDGELEDFKRLLQIREGREFYNKYLAEERKKNPNLLAPDFDEIYKKYFGLREKLDWAIYPKFKVGQEVWYLTETDDGVKEPHLDIYNGKVSSIGFDGNTIWINCDYENGLRYHHIDGDKNLFPTQAEAERALKSEVGK